MEFNNFVEWVFYAVIGGVSLQITSKISKLTESIVQLNERVAVVIEKTAWHEKQIDRHDQEIEALKSNKPTRKR